MPPHVSTGEITIPEQPFIFLGGDCLTDWRRDLVLNASYMMPKAQDYFYRPSDTFDTQDQNNASIQPGTIGRYGEYTRGVYDKLFLDPRVSGEWTEEDRQREELAKEYATGFVWNLSGSRGERDNLPAYSIAEAVALTIRRSEDIAIFLDVNPFAGDHNSKALVAIAKLLREESPTVFITNDLHYAAQWAAEKLMAAMTELQAV